MSVVVSVHHSIYAVCEVPTWGRRKAAANLGALAVMVCNIASCAVVLGGRRIARAVLGVPLG